ncbi:Imm1 family immunity protein [Streptomyces fradiae]|uniref:Imm1 family immunity protein n=1 Tax=Streptomyces fradiae TaxID=1906 RepID=UPI00380A1EEE
MILSVHTEETVFLEDAREVAQAINDALTAPSGDSDCDTISFAYHKDRGPGHEASLTVTINHESGYGGLVWYANGETAVRLAQTMGEEYAYTTWVSKASDPPSFDPKILSDPWNPAYMHRISAVPIATLHSALKEFCENGTGDRPGCIEWVEGNYDGTLLVDPDAG